MAKIIANEKNYTGRELENIFFRPMLTGPSAADLGVRIMYNMPVPTTFNYWKGAEDVLRKYREGWQGGTPAEKFQKKIELHKVKAELGYSASDYFGMIYELITNDPKVNLDDLSGTDLEKAETTLFRASVAESIRRTMWLGDTTRQSGYNTFDGFLKSLMADSTGEGETVTKVDIGDLSQADVAETLLKTMWERAPQVLKAFKDQGQLVYLTTSDVYTAYEDSLDSVTLESAYAAKQNGRPGLRYKGIPLIDVGLTGIIESVDGMPASFAILTDKRNLAVAVNTNTFPDMEVRMWYNPDEMENRQRAIFMAGCDYLMPELIVFATPAAVQGA